MSSWIIERKEYIKCAGFIAGLQDAKGKYSRSKLYLWNYKENHLFTKEEIKKEFLKVFACNVKSVCDQYGDYEEMNLLKQPESEAEKILFYKYHLIGSEWAFDKEKLGTAILKFSFFISCFEYQTEDEDEKKKGMAWLERCLSKMVELLRDLEDIGEWGEFNL